MQRSEDLQYVASMQESLRRQWNLLSLSASTNDRTDSTHQIREVKTKLEKFDQKIEKLHRRFRSKLKPSGHTVHEMQRLKRRMERCRIQMDRSRKNENEIDGVLITVGTQLGPKTRHKAHLSNNIIRIVRGPIKNIIHETMVAIDVYGHELRPVELIQQAVLNGLERQNRRLAQQRNRGNALKPAYAQVTSDWKFEGENDDQGLSSISIWMRNPHGQRCLVKTEDHPLSAANEWLVYVLGRTIGLPINIVQIALYQDQLVTLHIDVTGEDEKMITYMDSPREKRKLLLHEPLLLRMEVLDRLVQNVDRNQRNILITIPKTADINADPLQMKIHFVDHGASFGMHKLNAISIVASKLHCNRVGVISFEPEEEAQTFEQYLNKLPVEDRPFISDMLNRLAAITDKKLQRWMNEIKGLLTTDQYDQISEVLRLKRDVAKRCMIQWNLAPGSFVPEAVPPRRKDSESSLIMIYL